MNLSRVVVEDCVLALADELRLDNRVLTLVFATLCQAAMAGATSTLPTCAASSRILGALPRAPWGDETAARSSERPALRSRASWWIGKNSLTTPAWSCAY
jgi:hypothetical protein